MAEIEGFKYDIFISYSHDDNHSPTDTPGWVDRFHDALESWLKHRRGFRNLAIWRDKELDGNTEFNLSIENKIRQSALLFVLNSRNYFQSTYCRKELTWFHNWHGDRPDGLIVGEHLRIFNILLNNIPFQEWPEELGQTTGFALHDSASPEKLGDFTSPHDVRFEKQLRRVVDALEATLEEFAKLELAPGDQKIQTPEMTIFMANVADSLQDFRDRIVVELECKRVRVLTDIPPPMENIHHAQSVKQALSKARLSIHLLDQWPGRKISNQKAATYPRSQWEIALEKDVRKLVWAPVGVHPDSIEDQAQRDWLNHLIMGDRSSGQFEFVQSSPTVFLSVIQDIVGQLKRSQGNGNNSCSFLVDTHQKDQHCAYELAGFLAKNGVDVDFNKESRHPTRSLEHFEQAIGEVRNLIILAGKVEQAWIKGRIKKAFKIVAKKLFEPDEALALENIWVFLSPDSEGRIDLPPLPPLINIKILDNSHAESIDPQVISPLLQHASAGGAA